MVPIKTATFGRMRDCEERIDIFAKLRFGILGDLGRVLRQVVVDRAGFKAAVAIDQCMT
jgi:hypothetical protein